MTCTDCTGDCRQGRDCPSAANASRAALGLPALKQTPGAETVCTTRDCSSCVGRVCIAAFQACELPEDPPEADEDERLVRWGMAAFIALSFLAMGLVEYFGK